MPRLELIFLHSASGDGIDVRPVTFKSWWLSPKEVQMHLRWQTPLPSKRGSQAALKWTDQSPEPQSRRRDTRYAPVTPARQEAPRQDRTIDGRAGALREQSTVTDLAQREL